MLKMMIGLMTTENTVTVQLRSHLKSLRALRKEHREAAGTDLASAAALQKTSFYV